MKYRTLKYMLAAGALCALTTGCSDYLDTESPSQQTSQMIYEKWANARFKYRNRAFWCRGYYVDTVGKNAKKIEEYIRNQLKEDLEAEQLELEIEDPFTGNKR